MKTIEVLIGPKGETTITTKGFAGSSCRDASKSIEQAIGKAQSERLTAEFYQAEEVQQSQQQRT